MSYENIQLKTIVKGNGLNWIFIPGGPGLGSEYLEVELENSKLEGSAHVVRFLKYDNSVSDQEKLVSLKKDFERLCQVIPNAVLVGHSFGGMLLSHLNITPDLYKKIVLLNSPLDLHYQVLADSTFQSFTPEEKRRINDANAAYKINATDENLEKLFLSWSPYYAAKEFKSIFESKMSLNSYDHALFDWGQRFFLKQYSSKTTEAIIVFSEEDKIVSSEMYKDSFFNLKFLIKNAGHFPWIENSKGFFETMSLIGNKITSHNTSI